VRDDEDREGVEDDDACAADPADAEFAAASGAEERLEVVMISDSGRAWGDGGDAGAGARCAGAAAG
jgi:hypothetical protein